MSGAWARVARWAGLLAVAGTAWAGEDGERPARRDPFWPVGHVPAAPVAEDAAATEAEAAEAARRALVWPRLPVRGRSQAPDGSYRVLIDGVGVVAEGDVVSIPSRGLWFQWRIERIDERGVKSVRIGATEEAPPPKQILFENVSEPLAGRKEENP